ADRARGADPRRRAGDRARPRRRGELRRPDRLARPRAGAHASPAQRLPHPSLHDLDCRNGHRGAGRVLRRTRVGSAAPPRSRARGARAARSERLVALTTLAAGAAHELSTPLATIALASRELQHALDARRSDPDLAEDAQLIRREVDRCQAILDQMSGRAGGTAADEPELVALPELLAEVRSRFSSDDAGRLIVNTPLTIPPILLPRAGLPPTG